MNPLILSILLALAAFLLALAGLIPRANTVLTIAAAVLSGVVLLADLLAYA